MRDFAVEGMAVKGEALGRSIAVTALVFLTALLLALLAGYAIFAMSLDQREPRLTERAEGVVALTGGSDRVLDAAALLSRGQAQRLLITGVNRATRGSAIAKLLPVSRDLFDCCIDLGYQALDTAGNAIETRDWARKHNINRSLIVVTSNYHMPRALAEISAALPGVALLPYPVVSEHVNVADWARDRRVAELIGSEYLKYLGALLRTNFDGPPVDDAAKIPRSAATE